jgi:hypothetical protein
VKYTAYNFYTSKNAPFKTHIRGMVSHSPFYLQFGENADVERTFMTRSPTVPTISGGISYTGFCHSRTKNSRQFGSGASYANALFENLDIYDRHMPINLDISSLFEKKSLSARRGGYCLTERLIPLALLRTLGFHAFLSRRARVLMDKDEFPPLSHRANIVMDRRETLFFGDVGFGGPMADTKSEAGLHRFAADKRGTSVFVLP